MTNEKILLQLEKGYDITNPQLAQALSNLETKIIFDIKNDKDARYLLIKDAITKYNIYLYYEFLEKEDLRQVIIKFENEYSININDDIMDIIDILENRLQIL